MAAIALYVENAPFGGPVDDWIKWSRIDAMGAGVVAVCAVALLIGVIGTLQRLLAPAPKPAKQRRQKIVPIDVAPVAAMVQDELSVAAPDRRGSLKFDAQSLAQSSTRSNATVAFEAPSSAGTAVPLFAEPPTLEIHSLEPQIFDPHIVRKEVFSDNAADTFVSQPSAAVQPASEKPFDFGAALSDTHGLQISTSAQVIPIRPDVAVTAVADGPASVSVPEVHDPLEAALLAEAPHAPQIAPPSDMNAVISSAMRFIDMPPVAMPEAHPAEFADMPSPASVVETPVDDQAEIRQAVQTALSVWPDSTRGIAADELGARMTHLYHSPSPDTQKVFHLIASGDLSAAANALQYHADSLANHGETAEAAELWRAYGALHMGRDDAKAMTAYERVSDLDPADANIHLYLARRYQMAGDTAKQPVVLGRALAVIADPATRTELLTAYADLKMKAGDVHAAGDALEELSGLHAAAIQMTPDDISARSVHAITLARLAQAREMQGAFDKAGPAYQKAYQAFADLSAQKPDHAGLKAMADNALRDAQRFSMA